MADVVFTGTLAGTVTLPSLRVIGSPPPWPISASKQIEKAAMSDKSKRFALFDERRVWGIGLGYLTKTQLDAMILLNSRLEILAFVNNNEDATSYNVVITSFSYEPESTDRRGSSNKRYKVKMTVTEI